jgi:pilus assembly protein CpaC
MAKLLAEPTLVTLDGRPATFNVGGEVPIPLQQALGVTTVTYRQFGTQIDFVPIVLGNGMIRLEVRPDITEIDPSLRDTVTGVPGFRQRTADTAVEMKAGQTLAIAGLVFTREDSVNRGIPWLADLPWVGMPFRRVSNTRNDVELLIFVTPEFCEAMDAHEVPPCGPGQLTTTPTDVELYWRGYLEVPKNCNGPNGGHGGMLGPGAAGDGFGGPGYEQIPSGPPTAIPSAQGARSTSPAAKGTFASKPAPARVISAGAKTTPASATRSTSGQNGASAASPNIIGPYGYDDLK